MSRTYWVGTYIDVQVVSSSARWVSEWEMYNVWKEARSQTTFQVCVPFFVGWKIEVKFGEEARENNL